MGDKSGFNVELDLPHAREVRPDHPLASAWRKLNRAGVHFKELVERGRMEMEATSAAGTVEQRRIDDLHIGFYPRLLPVNADLACVVGDIAHGLRSALDNAAWALATTKARKVAFPLCESREGFEKLRGALEKYHPAATIEAFERLQPYHDRPGLRWLSDINNVDKHEDVVVVRHRLQLQSLNVTDSLTGETVLTSNGREMPPPQDLVDDTPVFVLEQGVPGKPRLSLKAAFENSLSLAPAEERSWPQERLDLVMRQCLTDVEDVLAELELFIDSAETAGNERGDL